MKGLIIVIFIMMPLFGYSADSTQLERQIIELQAKNTSLKTLNEELQSLLNERYDLLKHEIEVHDRNNIVTLIFILVAAIGGFTSLYSSIKGKVLTETAKYLEINKDEYVAIVEEHTAEVRAKKNTSIVVIGNKTEKDRKLRTYLEHKKGFKKVSCEPLDSPDIKEADIVLINDEANLLGMDMSQLKGMIESLDKKKFYFYFGSGKFDADVKKGYANEKHTLYPRLIESMKGLDFK